MKKIEAIIRQFKFEEVRTALNDIGVDRMTVTDVRCQRPSKSAQSTYRGQEYTTDTLPQTKLEIVVHDRDAELVVAAICRSARTGHIGDGNIFVYDVEGAMRIRNLQLNEAAL